MIGYAHGFSRAVSQQGFKVSSDQAFPVGGAHPVYGRQEKPGRLPVHAPFFPPPRPPPHPLWLRGCWCCEVTHHQSPGGRSPRYYRMISGAWPVFLVSALPAVRAGCFVHAVNHPQRHMAVPAAPPGLMQEVASEVRPQTPAHLHNTAKQ